MFRIAKSIFILNIKNPKNIAAIIMITCMLIANIRPVILMADSLGYRVNFGILSFLLAGRFSLVVNCLSAILIFSDLPVRQKFAYYAIHRAGKFKWIFAHFIYVAVVSAFLVLYISAVALLLCSRYIFFADNWGKIITVIANQSLNEIFGINISITPEILAEFSPGYSLVWTGVGIFITFVIFGLTSIIINIVVGEYVGTIANGAFVFISMLSGYFPSSSLFHLSPVDWCRLDVVDLSGYGSTPSVRYVIIARSILILLFIVCGQIITRKRVNIQIV